MKYDPIREMQEIRNQLSYSKRIGFLLGAGTSKSIGISDINQLTSKVLAALDSKYRTDIDGVKKCLSEPQCTIEDILNHVRLVREITCEKSGKSYEGLDGECAKSVDLAICEKIYDTIIEEEQNADLTTTMKFASWLNWLGNDFTKELFTLNYDLVLEKSFESLQVPYYDGFVGANEPFFLPESLEKDSKDNPPLSWIRLWKVHGSLGWFWKAKAGSQSERIVRLGVYGKKPSGTNEIVIYPSRDKYIDSRKQPFISYFDRLRSYLLDGEGLFMISGYSFRDAHVNSIIFDCLRHNNRLHVLGYFHSDSTIDRLQSEGHLHMNFYAYGATKAIIKGNVATWEKSAKDDSLDQFWDETEKKLSLGDFKKLVDFLLLCSGKKEKIEKDIAIT